ncbi:MAG: ubiquinol-cytochrome c reductase iron-sulfur subunit [Rickettsiales bacterium]|nr:MAG: ubiquinol-cytochrome c reductase iron-sulfur subunit [Rickettsiales bacterium]
MSDDNLPDDADKTTRRDFMTLTASSLTAVGAACVAFPLVDSLNPSADVLAMSSIEVDIGSIEPGQTMTVKWRGKPVFITNRTDEEIKEVAATQMKDLIDPQPDSDRVKKGHEKWLITIGICTHLGCVPISNKGDFEGWFCPCHGSHYDKSGRVRKGPAPLNLAVPPYEFITDTKIKIG